MAIPSSPPAPTTSASASGLETVLFFFSGLGSSLCYIATLSSLVFYKSTYGAQSYIYINLAVYLPLLPVAIAQARYDQDVDRLVGSANAFLCRGIVGYVLSIGALASIPLRSDGGLIFVCLPAVVGAAAVIIDVIVRASARRDEVSSDARSRDASSSSVGRAWRRRRARASTASSRTSIWTRFTARWSARCYRAVDTPMTRRWWWCSIIHSSGAACARCARRTIESCEMGLRITL